MLSSNEPISLNDVQDLIADVRLLLVPKEVGNAFERKYYNALQGEPAVVLAHAEVSKLLASNA